MHQGDSERCCWYPGQSDRLRSEFSHVPLNRPAVISRVAHIEDAAAGEIWVVWAAGETDATGVYRAEFEVLYDDGKVETFPNDGYISVQILENLR